MAEYLFLDTEFSEFRSNDPDSKLISIALINEAGDKSFYAELIDHYTEDECSDFVQKHVLPLLDAEEIQAEFEPDHFYAKATWSECNLHLQNWIASLDGVHQVVSNAPEFDGPFFFEIFADTAWPNNLLPDLIDCESMPGWQSTNSKEYTQQSAESEKLRIHHALDDAKALRLAFATMRG